MIAEFLTDISSLYICSKPQPLEILGIDVGGTGIKGALVNIKTGELVSERFRLDTPNPSKPDAIAETIAEIIGHFNWKDQVGCGFPTVVSHGVAKMHSNLHKSWKGVNVEEMLSTKTNCDFTVINDADAAGLASIQFGHGKGLMGKVLFLTVGTGIGSALFIDGKLIPNLELGRINSFKGEEIELYASRRAKEEDDLSLKKWAKRFDYFLEHVDTIISPDHIIIGGGLSKKFDKFKKHLTTELPIQAAKKGNNAGIVGAALSVTMVQ